MVFKSNLFKQGFYWLLMLLITASVLEVMARVAHRIYWEQGFSGVAESSTSYTSVSPQETMRSVPNHMLRHIIHPYSGTTLANEYLAMNRAFGRNDNASFTVGLFGGSVALNLKNELAKQLQQAFDRHHVDKKVLIELYAAGGMKQPQQLMQLNFALSIGKQFDLVLNIDGYNESALSIGENLRRGISPFYPRLWDLALAAYYQRRDPTDHKAEKLRGRLEYYSRLSRAALFRNSAFFGFGLSLFRQAAENDVYAYNQFARKRAPIQNLEHMGPEFPTKERAQAYQIVADHWKKSSEMMSHMKTLFDYKYMHFLQPNQYFDGTKILTLEELEHAIDKASYRPKLISDIYPLMQRNGLSLKHQNINFYDLTNVFLQTEETVYVDKCCHVNKLGNRLLANQIVTQIMSVLGKDKTVSDKPSYVR